MGVLTKETVVDKMEILEDGTVQVREVTRIMEDDVLISQSFHRRMVMPGDDVTEDREEVRNVVAVVQTPEKVAKFNERMQKRVQ